MEWFWMRSFCTSDQLSWPLLATFLTFPKHIIIITIQTILKYIEWNKSLLWPSYNCCYVSSMSLAIKTSENTHTGLRPRLWGLFRSTFTSSWPGAASWSECHTQAEAPQFHIQPGIFWNSRLERPRPCLPGELEGQPALCPGSPWHCRTQSWNQYCTSVVSYPTAAPASNLLALSSQYF